MATSMAAMPIAAAGFDDPAQTAQPEMQDGQFEDDALAAIGDEALSADGGESLESMSSGDELDAETAESLNVDAEDSVESDGVVYSASGDETVKALDAETGEEIWESTAHSDTVGSVAPSPDEDTVYSGSYDDTVKALDAETGEEIWESTAHSDSVESVAPSPDGDIVYSGGSDNTVKALDSETGDEIWESTANSGVVYSVASSPDGDIVYSTGSDNTVKALDADDGEEIWEVDLSSNVMSVAPSPDGEIVYSDSTDDTVIALDAETGDEIWESTTHSGSLRSVAPSPDGDIVYSGSFEGTVKALDADGGEEIWESTAHSDTVQSVAPSSDGDVVYSGSDDDMVKALDAGDGEEIWESDAHSGSVESVATTGMFAAGDPTTGVVEDQSGSPVENATVAAQGSNPPNFSEDLIEDLETEAENADELVEELGDLPEEFDEFQDEFETGDHLVDADDWADDIDATYPLVHEEDDWGVGTTTLVQSSVDDPQMQIDSGETVVISLWDPAEDGWVENQVDGSFPGAATEGDVEIRQIDPFGDPLDTETHSTQPEYETTGANPISTNEHHAVKTQLSTGIYQAYPEDHPERAYTFTVGEPTDLVDNFADDLRDEAGDLTERSQTLQNLRDEDFIVTERTSTNEDGEFEIDIPEGTEHAQLQAYQADSEIIDTLEDIREDEFDEDDPPGIEDIELSDLRDYQSDFDYNGSFHLPAESRSVDPGDQNVTVQTYGTTDLPFGDMDRYDSIEEFLEEQRLDDRVSDIQDEYDEEFAEMDEARLEATYQMHVPIVETVPNAEDNYLNESEFDEIQDADDLDRDELETETELMQEATVDLDNIGTPDWDEDHLEIDDGELQVEIPLPAVDHDSVAPEIHWADGSSDSIDEDYYSIESNGLFGEDTLVIEEFPIDADDSAMFDVRVTGGGDDGMLDDRISGQNPAFEGEVPDIRSVDLNTKSPGSSDRVSMTFRPDDDSSFGDISDVQVTNPEGESVNTSTEDDSATFTTDGAGQHRVQATVTDSTGSEFVKTFSIRALEDPRSDPPTIRAETGVGDETFALAGEGLRDAEVATDGGQLEATAVTHEGDTPGSIHLKPQGALEGTTHDIDITVVEGENERSVSSNIETVIHFDSLQAGDDSTVWRGDSGALFGDPLDFDGSTRYGEMIDRSDDDDEKYVLRSYTEGDGSVSFDIDEDPGRISSWEHRIALSLPSLTFPFSPLSVAGGAVPVVFGAGWFVYRRHGFAG
ncbi:hypothetical protein BB347_18755 (plasmid) [Natronorubrum daqingense]|nr:hypothetical protein BB347_18755 [Natronorubrum daqingense]